MYLAALGDIHGNLPALDAALHAIDDAGILTVLNTGDCVGGGAGSNEVLDRLRERRMLSVQGEMDRQVLHFLRKREPLRKKLDPAEFAMLERAYESLASRNLEALRDLPKKREIIMEGIGICLFHGVPTSQSDFLKEDDDLNRFRRIREISECRLYISGGTHKRFFRFVDEALFVNPGAVDTPGAAQFAIIDTETNPWSVRFEQAPY